MQERIARVVRGYQAAYPEPLEVRKGERVRIERHETDPEWRGWVWCTSESGKSGWISGSFLEIQEHVATVFRDYTARELTATQWSPIRILTEDHGWLWCEDAKGERGWLPARNVETFEQRKERVVKEKIALAPYDPGWPAMFEEEKRHLLRCLPLDLLGRIEHFGSTAVPGLPAKPIVDMLVEVRSLEETKRRIAPLLEAQGYDCFWRPTLGEEPPYYAWFIKRDSGGYRTHHIHMIEAECPHWDRLLFRDYLIAHPEVAAEYAALKQDLSDRFPDDQEAYTRGKSEFIARVTQEAKASRPDRGAVP